MEEELKLIDAMGFVTSKELEGLMDKQIRSIIANLNRLERWKEIEVIYFRRHKLYVSRKILNLEISIEG